MKVRIIKPDQTEKVCSRCGHNIFRKSTKTRYTNPEETEGETYGIIICNKCSHVEERYNIQKWKTIGEVIRV
jgi:ribosomal protein L37E